MAGWMWLRCVFGPHLQRIHRSPDQSRPDGRAARRVRSYRVLHVFEWSRMLKPGVFSSLGVSVSQADSRKFAVFVIESLLSSHRVTGVNGKWMDGWNGSRIYAAKSQNWCLFVLPARAHVSYAAWCLRRWHWPGFANVSKQRTLVGINEHSLVESNLNERILSENEWSCIIILNSIIVDSLCQLGRRSCNDM